MDERGMGELPKLLSDLGEKEIIRRIIGPLFNPTGSLDSVGDDCAIFPVGPGRSACASTDRVPADLVSFKLGIIDHRGLGNYLAVLNLSDLAAMGAEPSGMLLNLGLPKNMLTRDFVALLEGARDACAANGCAVIGGDLSSSAELSISATSLGTAIHANVLRRYGASIGDCVYCSDQIGLSATAFAYFLNARPGGFTLSEADEELLKNCFRKPRPRFDVGRALASSNLRVTAMDNTDGAAQSLSEIASAGRVGVELDCGALPIHPISYAVADFLNLKVEDLALGPGADFQLLGTIEPNIPHDPVLSDLITLIGVVVDEPGIRLVKQTGERVPLVVRGWDYYASVETDHVGDLEDHQ